MMMPRRSRRITFRIYVRSLPSKSYVAPALRFDTQVLYTLQGLEQLAARTDLTVGSNEVEHRRNIRLHTLF
jgi:hypothetical protein